MTRPKLVLPVSLVLGSFMLALLLLAPPALAGRPSTGVRTKILRSRAAVARAFGKRIAKQIPASFSFERFALVWLDLPVNRRPRLRIYTVPAKRPLRLHFDPSLWLTVTREARTLRFELGLDSPCSGGAPQPPSYYQACARRMKAAHAAARGTVRLFATPRRRLRKAMARQIVMPGRP